MDSAKPKLDEIQHAIKALFAPGQVVELRVLGNRLAMSGYYNDHEKLAVDVFNIADKPEYDGVYWTLQNPNPALLARSPNKLKRAERGGLTSDVDVLTLRWLLIDLDPQRPAKISASDEEKSLAHSVANEVIKYFRALHHAAILADSGNGYHVLVRIDIPASDAPLLQRVLAALDQRFSTDAVKVDRTVYNPSRISKAYGTVSRKGANAAERPHRASSLIYIPDPLSPPLDKVVLEQIASEAVEDEKKRKKGGKTVDVDRRCAKLEEFLKLGGIKHEERENYKDGWKWIIETCPFNPEHHDDHAVIVTVAKDGALGFKCSHNSCKEYGWPEFRKKVEQKIGHPFIFTETVGAGRRIWISNDPGKLDELVKQSEGLLHGIGGKYFERNGELVHISYGRDVPESKGITRDASSVVVQIASHDTIIRDLDKLAIYFNLGGVDEDTGDIIRIPCHVPVKVAFQICDRVKTEVRDVPFATLDLVTPSPVLLPNGGISSMQFEEGVLFRPRNWGMYETVPPCPTHDDAIRAMEQFKDVFSGFPFVDGNNYDPEKRFQTASYSVVLSGVLSLASRPALRYGPVPPHMVSASQPRYGKTKIVEAVNASALGHLPTAVSFLSEEEFAKQLIPLMQSADRSILIDNVEVTLQGAKLCILITGNVMRDRILGKSEDVHLKNVAVFFATGNNLVVGGDLTARALRCDIDQQCEHPEKREFDFDPVQRAMERHPQLIVAALTALRAFWITGMKWKLDRQPWGGFEAWDKLVSGCLTWLGYADPVLARDRIIEKDPIRSTNAEILAAWRKQYGAHEVSLREIRKDGDTVGGDSELYDLLLHKGHWDGNYAKWLLMKMENKVIDGLKLQRVEGRSRFCVTQVGSAKHHQNAESVESGSLEF